MEIFTAQLKMSVRDNQNVRDRDSGTVSEAVQRERWYHDSHRVHFRSADHEQFNHGLS